MPAVSPCSGKLIVATLIDVVMSASRPVVVIFAVGPSPFGGRRAVLTLPLEPLLLRVSKLQPRTMACSSFLLTNHERPRKITSITKPSFEEASFMISSDRCPNP